MTTLFPLSGFVITISLFFQSFRKTQCSRNIRGERCIHFRYQESKSHTLKISQRTYTGLLLNFKSFTSCSYKISWLKCLTDRLIKICNNWNSFQNDTEDIKSNLIKKVYPPFLIHKVIKKYPDYKFSSSQNQLNDTSNVYYFKLPYIGKLWHRIKINFRNLAKNFVNKILTLS